MSAIRQKVIARLKKHATTDQERAEIDQITEEHAKQLNTLFSKLDDLENMFND